MHSNLEKAEEVQGAHLSNDEIPGACEADEVHEAYSGEPMPAQLWNVVHKGVQQLRSAGHQAYRVYQHLHSQQQGLC